MYPYTSLRTNKNYSINSIEIMKDRIKVDMTFRGSNLYSSISVQPSLSLETSNGEIAELINVENIKIKPQKTEVSVGKLHNFTLYFRKIEGLKNKRFSITSPNNSVVDIYMFDIELNENNKQQAENQNPKDDYFLSLVPVEILSLYYFEHFLDSNNDVRTIFERIVEAQVEGNLPVIENITSEEIDLGGKIADAYTITSKNNSAKISSYYINKDENGNRINSIMIYFNSTEEAGKFLESLATWYGSSYKKGDKSAIWIPIRTNKVVFFNINERGFATTVDINILTDDEFKTLKNNQK